MIEQPQSLIPTAQPLSFMAKVCNTFQAMFLPKFCDFSSDTYHCIGRCLQRTMKLIKVIGAGFGRTGTTSLKLALEQLGFGRCYHFTEVLRAGHAAAWLNLANGEKPDWDTLLEGYLATSDWPAASHYRELAQHYPDARVVLTVRDRDAWHESLCKTLLPLRDSLSGWPYRLIPAIRRLADLSDAAVWDGTFAGRAADRSHAIAVYERHCAEVRNAIPAERLLEFDVRDGWEPLCNFLGVPVPQNSAFPRSNDTATVRRYVLAIRTARLLLPLVLVLAAVIAILWLT